MIYSKSLKFTWNHLEVLEIVLEKLLNGGTFVPHK